MTPRQIINTIPFALGAAFAAFSASSAMAAEPFDACTDRNWDAFAAAVESGSADDLSAFLELIGPNCPLGPTATVLLCEIDPAACLARAEPAGGRPEIDVPERERPDLTLTYVPGAHIGVERDGRDPGGNDGGSQGGNGGGGTSTSTDTGPSDNDRGNDRGNDKPTNEPGNSISSAL